MNIVSNQEKFWTETYSENYMRRNNSFDHNLGVQAWKIMLKSAEIITSFLECGCNIGRNLGFLKDVIPAAKSSVIEISKAPFEYVQNQYVLDKKFNGSILNSNFSKASFDLVYTTSVLIHIHPDNLIANMTKIFDYSNRYILIGEYFNRTPTMIEYQNHTDMLFKRDFGKLFLENYSVKLVDYGFLWGHIYDSAGFDDITWWLFEKS